MIDMTGKPCPIPVIEAKKALRTASPGEQVQILVDNDIARQNLEKMALGQGHPFAFAVTDDGNILVTIDVSSESSLKPETDDGSGLVVAIGQEGMGAGSDELAKTLMKSFIYSLTELDTAPEHILFFNSGVFLSTEGSGALDDLRTLESKGTVINSCGACLNYYSLTEKLSVGSVTNMYAIASVMAQAKRLINM